MTSTFGNEEHPDMRNRKWMTHSSSVLAAIAVGSAVVSHSHGQVIHENRKLLADDAQALDRFGCSVAIDQGLVAVGAWYDDDRGNEAGSAYLFDALTGHQVAKLLPEDGAEAFNFGNSIALQDHLVAVGAWFDGENGERSGAVYLFSGDTGEQLHKLLPLTGRPGGRFGFSVAIADGFVAVGEIGNADNGNWSGAAYLFDAATGDQVHKLLATDGTALDRLGQSIAIGDGVVVAGAIYDQDDGPESGSAYVFDVQTGAQIAKLNPDDGAPDDWFGFSVSVESGVIAIGAIGDDDLGLDSGSVYLFDRATGAQTAKLLPSDGAWGDSFGHSVAIDGGIVVVGSMKDDDRGASSGSAYVFDLHTGNQIVKLRASDGTWGDFFGGKVDVEQGIVVVGAQYDNAPAARSGSAYVFDVNCVADLTGDGVLDIADVQMFLDWYYGQFLLADFELDGTLNFFDLQAYLNLFTAECP